jgi:TRAP-type uncharacterized transport system substrate-binding protein
MVAYDHPVFHNGRRVLWRGAWRIKEPERGAPLDLTTPAASKAAAAVAAAPRPPPPGDYSILFDADDPCAARLAGELVAALQAKGMNGRAIAGRTSPTALAAAVKGDAADLAVVPMDALLGDDKASADWRERAPYIARIGAEPIAIVAPREIADIRQLDGRAVGFGVADGAGATTAATLFALLRVAPKPTFAPLASSLADLAAGKLAAVVAVGAKSSRTLADFGKDGRFHLVAVPWSPALRALYAPARLTAKDLPNLVGADEKVDTLGAPLALVAIDSPASSPREGRSAALTKSFFEGFDALLAPDNDASWREVNLAAAAPWPRLRAAQAWIDLNATASNASLDAFRAIAKTVASANGGPGAEDSERLYNSLMQWRGAGQ